MPKTLESPASSMRLAAGAKAAILVVARGFSALLAEHSLALRAATKAALPRRRLTDLRAMYTTDQDRTGDPGYLALQEDAATGRPSRAPSRGFKTTTMDMSAENRYATAIQGQLLRLSERREVAIYLRKDALWVADFIDGHGELIDAATWFRFNCGMPATSYARRRMVFESAIPLSAQLVARIEYLHRSAAERQRGEAVRLVGATAAYGPRSRIATILLKPFGRRMYQGDPSGGAPV